MLEVIHIITLMALILATLHAGAGLIGFGAVAWARFSDAVTSAPSDIQRVIAERWQRLPPEAFDPAGAPFLMLTPKVVALFAPPAWLRRLASLADGTAAREFLGARKRMWLSLIALVLCLCGLAIVVK